MAAKVDSNYVRLTIAYNEVVNRKAVGQLPRDLQGSAIPDQVLAHERELQEKRAASSGEKGVRETGADVFDQTERFLTRLRHGILSGYEEPEDPRIAAYGPLGVARNQHENQQRLTELAPKIKTALASGEIALVADLQPGKLTAHAKAHADLNTGKVAATTTRQVEGTELVASRHKTAQMLQRIKNFVKSFYGPGELTAFGFDVPAPPSRPRLRDVPADTAASETKPR